MFRDRAVPRSDPTVKMRIGRTGRGIPAIDQTVYRQRLEYPTQRMEPRSQGFL